MRKEEIPPAAYGSMLIVEAQAKSAEPPEREKERWPRVILRRFRIEIWMQLSVNITLTGLGSKFESSRAGKST